MKILIVAKQSKFEYEKDKFNLSDEQIMKKYQSEHANLEAILKSHEAQIESRRRLRELMYDVDVLLMDQHLVKESRLQGLSKNYDLIVALGGDNSFSYISHYVDNKPLLAINSDPARSTGALCSWSSRDLDEIAERIKKENYRIEEWARLDSTIYEKNKNGETLHRQRIIPATSEYFFGEDRRKDMSRYILIYRGKEQEQKSSGIIIATGAGSTGWYDSANRHVFPKGNVFPKTEEKAAFVVTEPYLYKATSDYIFHGEILPGEELIIHSLNDGRGYASPDAWEEYDFSRGKTAIIRISDNPLKVIVP